MKAIMAALLAGTYLHAAELKPDYATAHYNLGVALYHKGRLDEAIAEFRTAIELNPGDARAHRNLGTALADKNINVIAIAQGSSEYNLSLVVDESEADNAVRAIHHSIVNH